MCKAISVFFGCLLLCVVNAELVTVPLEYEKRYNYLLKEHPELVEDGIHLAIPWRWVRGINEIITLRWFPPTPIPKNP